jgi:hypothetical protein
MKKTSRRTFAMQLTGALAALPLASTVVGQGQRKPIWRPKASSPRQITPIIIKGGASVDFQIALLDFEDDSAKKHQHFKVKEPGKISVLRLRAGVASVTGDGTSGNPLEVNLNSQKAEIVLEYLATVEGKSAKQITPIIIKGGASADFRIALLDFEDDSRGKHQHFKVKESGKISKIRMRAGIASVTGNGTSARPLEITFNSQVAEIVLEYLAQ